MEVTLNKCRSSNMSVSEAVRWSVVTNFLFFPQIQGNIKNSVPSLFLITADYINYRELSLHSVPDDTQIKTKATGQSYPVCANTLWNPCSAVNTPSRSTILSLPCSLWMPVNVASNCWWIFFLQRECLTLWSSQLFFTKYNSGTYCYEFGSHEHITARVVIDQLYR